MYWDHDFVCVGGGGEGFCIREVVFVPGEKELLVSCYMRRGLEMGRVELVLLVWDGAVPGEER